MTNTTNKNTVTANTAKVDFFQSARTLSTRTAEFFRCVIKKAELNTIYNEKIQKAQNSIEASINVIENGSTIITKEEAQASIEKWQKVIEVYKEELAKLLKEQASFEYTDYDKVFRKTMKDATSLEDVKTAVRAFYKSYKLDVANTTFENAVLESIGKKVDTKTIVKSNGTKVLKYDVTNALKNLYGVAFEWMVEAGTIKPADIPSVLVDKYAKKSKNKKSDKKEVKKAA